MYHFCPVLGFNILNSDIYIFLHCTLKFVSLVFKHLATVNLAWRRQKNKILPIHKMSYHYYWQKYIPETTASQCPTTILIIIQSLSGFKVNGFYQTNRKTHDSSECLMITRRSCTSLLNLTVSWERRTWRTSR